VGDYLVNAVLNYAGEGEHLALSAWADQLEEAGDQDGADALRSLPALAQEMEEGRTQCLDNGIPLDRLRLHLVPFITLPLQPDTPTGCWMWRVLEEPEGVPLQTREPPAAQLPLARRGQSPVIPVLLRRRVVMAAAFGWLSRRLNLTEPITWAVPIT
jgi:hypothetical protein